MAYKRLSQSQRDCLEVIAKTGILPVNNQKKLGISNKTVRALEKEGLIKKETVLYRDADNHKKQEVQDCYTFTSNGSQRAKRYFDSVYNGSARRHNIELNNQYCNLTETERNSWLTENQIRNMLVQTINNTDDDALRNEYYTRLADNQISVPDCCYISEQGTMESIEITTNSYTREIILEKMWVCSTLGIAYNEVKI